MNKYDCFILDGGKDHPILVYMPEGARKMNNSEQLKLQMRSETKIMLEMQRSKLSVILIQVSCVTI